MPAARQRTRLRTVPLLHNIKQIADDTERRLKPPFFIFYGANCVLVSSKAAL